MAISIQSKQLIAARILLGLAFAAAGIMKWVGLAWIAYEYRAARR